MRSIPASVTFLVICLVCWAMSAAGAAVEQTEAVTAGAGLRKVLQQQTKSAPCAHAQATKQVAVSSTQAKQSLTAFKGAAAAAVPNRQLLQVAPGPKRPVAPLNPTQRQGFKTGRRPLPASTVQRQQRKVPPASG